MSSHGEWYPSAWHVIGVWLIWSLIILVTVAITSGSFNPSLPNPVPDSTYRVGSQSSVEPLTELPTVCPVLQIREATQ